MKTEDRYHKFVQWSEEDGLYIGYCPDLFPAGGVCHGKTSLAACKALCKIVADTVATADAEGIELPPSRTRPMMEPILA